MIFSLVKNRFNRILDLAARPVALFFISMGLIWSVAQWLDLRSLWLDEAFVAVNIRSRSFLDLFSTLDYAQQFPRFYLALIWMGAHWIDYDLLVLRFFPFLFGAIGLLFWSYLIWTELKPAKDWLKAAAVAYLCLNHVFFQYVGDLKQYTGDFFWAAWGAFYTLRVLPTYGESAGKKWLWFSALACFPILLSNVYILVLMAGFLTGVFPALREQKQTWKRGSLFILIAGVFFALSWLSDLRFIPDGMHSYWQEFFIRGENPVAWAASFWNALTRLTGDWLLARLGIPLTLLAIVGAAGPYVHRTYFDERSTMANLGGILLVGLLALGALWLYPLDGERLTLFFYPFSVLLIFKGFDIFLKSNWKPIRWVAAAFVLVLFTWSLVRKTPELSAHVFYKEHWENINPSIQKLNSELSPYVVYSPGSKAQIEAFPNLPQDFKFVYFENVSTRPPLSTGPNPWVEEGFYYLMAYPGDEQEILAHELSQSTSIKLEQLDKHLFWFNPVD